MEEFLEVMMSRDPCADLGDQVFGDIDGVGLAVDFEGHMLGIVEGSAVVAPAGRPAASVGVRRQCGGQQGTGGSDLFQPAVEHSADGGRMFGDAHGGSGPRGLE